jgi:hypothetical protein
MTAKTCNDQGRKDSCRGLCRMLLLNSAPSLSHIYGMYIQLYIYIYCQVVMLSLCEIGEAQSRLWSGARLWAQTAPGQRNRMMNGPCGSGKVGSSAARSSVNLHSCLIPVFPLWWFFGFDQVAMVVSRLILLYCELNYWWGLLQLPYTVVTFHIHERILFFMSFALTRITAWAAALFVLNFSFSYCSPRKDPKRMRSNENCKLWVKLGLSQTWISVDISDIRFDQTLMLAPIHGRRAAASTCVLLGASSCGISHNPLTCKWKEAVTQPDQIKSQRWWISIVYTHIYIYIYLYLYLYLYFYFYFF